MNRKLSQSVRLFALCLWAIVGIHNLRAQSTNAPVLSLAPGASPALTVTGIPGASYQVQFASKLAASNQWTALTNILLSNSAYLLHDPATASNAARFYRALLLSSPSNIFNGYAPAQISSGEIYRFVASDFGVTSTQTLFISSATNGVWMAPPNSLPIGGVTAVGLNFTRLSSLTIQLDVIFPATSTNSPPTTNSYLLAFTGTSAGVFEGPLGSPEPSVGNFSRITNLIGANVVPQLAAGEIWSLSASNVSGQNSTETLVMDSATNGWWIVAGNPPSGGISAATAQFTPQNPLGGTLVVIVPSSFPVTNTFSVEFTTTNSGLLYGALPGLGSAVIGTFTHDTTLVGKSVAPPQLSEGEIYQLSISNGLTPTAGTIAVESPSFGWVAFPTQLALNALVAGGVQYSQLGPFSGNLTITGLFNPPATNLFTNTCMLVYTSTNSGFLLTTLGIQPNPGSFGTFVRNAAFIGQTFAPLQLTPGDTYQLTTTSESFPPGQSFTVNSATDGLWLTTGQFSALTTLDTAMQYRRIGPLSGVLTAVDPTTPTPSTNNYVLLFTGTNNGLFEGPDSLGSSTLAAGAFSRNTALENQTFAPAQLTTNEIYQLVITNSPTVATQTLILNSATAGMLIIPSNAPYAGIYPASLQYAPLGALGANLTIMLPPIGGLYPTTNVFLLDYTSAAAGLFQVSAGFGPLVFIGSTGGFTRSTALVGQNLAPQQLVDGESYQLTVTNQPPSTAETLVMNSATTGFWAITGGAQGGFFSASVQYAPLGPLAASLNVIVPPGTNSTAGFTNNFTLIFNSATNGLFQYDNSLGSPLPAGTFVHSTP